MQDIPFINNWKGTLLVALLLGIMVGVVQIFLQPFDTYQMQGPYKSLRLAGYSMCVVLSVLVWHTVEKIWFSSTGKRWHLYQEVITVATLFSTFGGLGYLYHEWAFSSWQPSLKEGMLFFFYFGLPFAPLLIPLLAYFRFIFGKIHLPVKEMNHAQVVLKGENQEEGLTVDSQTLAYIKAQQNYVSLFFLEDGEMCESMIRSTLSSILGQLPFMYQVHRSFLVNLDFVERVEGNSRKRMLYLKQSDDPIPVSTKFYLAIQQHLQNRP